MKRFLVIAVSVAFIHALLAVAFAAVASRAAEREVFAGRLRLHALYHVMGEVAQLLFYPLMLMRSEVYEPRTTILFVSNSLIWGIAAAAAWHMYSRWRTRASPVR